MVFDGCPVRKELIVAKDGGTRTCTDKGAFRWWLLAKKISGKDERKVLPMKNSSRLELDGDCKCLAIG